MHQATACGGRSASASCTAVPTRLKPPGRKGLRRLNSRRILDVCYPGATQWKRRSMSKSYASEHGRLMSSEAGSALQDGCTVCIKPCLVQLPDLPCWWHCQTSTRQTGPVACKQHRYCGGAAALEAGAQWSAHADCPDDVFQHNSSHIDFSICIVADPGIARASLPSTFKPLSFIPLFTSRTRQDLRGWEALHAVMGTSAL